MKRVLVVDDEPQIIKVIIRVLKKIGIEEISSASNGREALDSISKTGIMPNLLITDWDMPVMGGKELLENINKLPSEKLKILIMSGNSCIEEKSAFAILQKPFNQRELIETVKNILHL